MEIRLFNVFVRWQTIDVGHILDLLLWQRCLIVIKLFRFHFRINLFKFYLLKKLNTYLKRLFNQTSGILLSLKHSFESSDFLIFIPWRYLILNNHFLTLEYRFIIPLLYLLNCSKYSSIVIHFLNSLRLTLNSLFLL